MKPTLPRIESLIQDTINYSTKIEFANLTATQLTTIYLPITHSGPGSITQSPDGYFEIKTHVIAKEQDNYYTIDSSSSLADSLEFGTVIPEDFYFGFEGIDYEGIEWQLDKVWTSCPESPFQEKRLITSRTNKLKTKSKWTATRYVYTLKCIHQNFEFPCNEFTDNESGKFRNRSCFTINNIDIVIIIKEHVCDIIFTSEAKQDERTYEGIILAIQIIQGHQLAVVAKISEEPGVKTVELTALRKDEQLWLLPPPIKTLAPITLETAKQAIQAISSLYLSKSSAHIFQYFKDLTLAYRSGIEAAALAASISVEGMASKYFAHLSNPDPQFVEECLSSKPVIEQAFNDGKISERVKNKLISSINSTKSKSPRNTLFKLFPKDLVDTWARVRHPSAHGTLIDAELSVSELAKCTYTSIYMFYTMMLYQSGFDGQLIDYSRTGYPVVKNVVKKKVSILFPHSDGTLQPVPPTIR